MCNRRVTESLMEGGWSEPRFPASIQQLHEKFAAFCGNIDLQQVGEAAQKVRGFVHAENRQEASDGYVGFCTIIFAVGGGLVAIRLPHADGADFEDGTCTDRSTCAYTMGPVPQLELTRAALALTAALPTAVVHPCQSHRGFGWLDFGVAKRA